MNHDERTAPIRLRRLALGTPGRILAGATIVVALAACQDQSPSAPSQPSRSNSPSAAVGTSSPQPAPSVPDREPFIYQATTKPCELLDHQLLIRTFGPDSDDVTPPQYSHNKILTTMACNCSYGHDTGATTVVAARVELADPDAITMQYQGLRGVQQKRTLLTDIPGLGQAAYSYTDQDGRAQLALHDGNAYLTISATPVAGAATPPAQALPVLTQTAQHMLAELSTRR